MNFEPIDKQKWKRAEYFEHYSKNVPCTYSVVVKVDITNIKSKNIRLYPAMLYCLTNVVNRLSEFRTAFDANGVLGIYSEMLPCYTVFNKESSTFSSIWTNYSENFSQFLADYNNDVALFSNKDKLIAKPNVPQNVFNVSMIPWLSFEGFNLNLKKDYDYLLPIFTMGKFYQKDGRYFLPLAIQVHHAVCDGYHVGKFVEDLQLLIDTLE